MINALQEKTIHYEIIEGKEIPVFDDVFHDAGWISKAIETMKRLASSRNDMFTIIEDKSRINMLRRYSIKRPCKDAQTLVFMLRNGYAEKLIHLFPNYEVNPFLRSLVINKDFYSTALAIDYAFPPYGNDPVGMAKILNCFVEAIRQDAKNPEFRRAVKNFERSSNKNHKSLMSYIDALFRVHSKLLVLRIDLEYRVSEEDGKSWGVKLNHEQVAKHRVAFFRALPAFLKKTLDKDVLAGFVWKLEYGPVNGWHYHSLIFLDGQKVRQDVSIGKAIGEYWNEVTGDVGRYYNCNGNKKVYEQRSKLGIGLIDHRDRALRKNLESEVSAYLTKVDACVKLTLPDKARGFGKGVLSETKNPKKGRPRKQSQSASVSRLLIKDGTVLP